MNTTVSIFWFRRDLRLNDNTALHWALENEPNILPIFIFDDEIISELPKNDHRINFIYDNLKKLHVNLKEYNSTIKIYKGNILDIWNNLLNDYSVKSVYFNKDYEPYALRREKKVKLLLKKYKVPVFEYKDQVIFEEHEILKDDNTNYNVFTHYKKKWYKTLEQTKITIHSISNFSNLLKCTNSFPSLNSLGFEESTIKAKNYNLNCIETYAENRNYPFVDATSYLSVHLRFGTVSIREMTKAALQIEDKTFCDELIWREFFMYILFHHPHLITQNYRKKYDNLRWKNNQQEFNKWCKGNTGFALVDAGIRELNTTGYMHNRVRMLCANFLCKILLIDWRWGEAYFAKKLFDYELSSNNGNWQWSAGTGCDAAPYFRIFNPDTQIEKFDKEHKYIKKWIEEYDSKEYPQKIIDYKKARTYYLDTVKNIKF